MSIKDLVAARYQKNEENMCSNIPENKKLTNQLESIRKSKHHLYLQKRIEIKGNTSKDTSMALVNNPEKIIRITTTEHLTKSIKHKTETTEME